MNVNLSFAGFDIPVYGLMIVLGVITANLIAWYLLKYYRLDKNDFLIIEAYVFLGSFFGSKLLYVIINFEKIEWNRLIELDYFNQIMQGGFVFYGGLLGGLSMLLLPSKLHHINVDKYVRHFIFLIPWIHAWGRIGCYFTGCCYGKPYQGPMAVMYSESSPAPTGVSLFPIQLTEAVCLYILSLVIFQLDFKKKCKHTMLYYLGIYSILRFIIEFFRYDTQRGNFWIFSTSQWISIGILSGIIIYICKTVQVINANKKN